ncbi:hypothetical protein Glove_79g98 [Diversispora epigaea]|uniref:Uncharacterized protein n=1 Tax=Diversispora epigaea TaxID=1348612 RepID=A0A397JBS2_9GLOM|nr:hypothetical protein Glove_79g98 [Diversispora epigaea]
MYSYSQQIIGSNQDNNNNIRTLFREISEFHNVLPIFLKSLLKFLKKILKNVYLNNSNKFTLDNLLNEIKRLRKLEIRESILKLYSITKQDNTNNYVYDYEYVNESSFRQYLKNEFQKMDWDVKLNIFMEF